MSAILYKTVENDNHNSVEVSYTGCCKTKHIQTLTVTWNDIGRFTPNIQLSIPLYVCKKHKSFLIELNKPFTKFIFYWPNVKPTNVPFLINCYTFWPTPLQKFS